MKFKTVAAAILFGLVMGIPSALPVKIVHAEAIPLRGIVEGFYGTPWQDSDRRDMITFAAAHGLNAYIYAPKDDPYHRKEWRVPYPQDKLAELSKLVALANNNDVRFIFAISPGLDLQTAGKEGQADLNSMIAKLESVYTLGVRDFAIFFDDIDKKDGKTQALFINAVSDAMHARHPDIHPFIAVPTDYYYSAMAQPDGTPAQYTADFATNLSPDVLVLYTGEGVVPPSLSDADLDKADALYHRNLGIWWNYPVNDYLKAKLALGPIEGLPVQSKIPAIFFNPMDAPKLSKIALATGAKYALDPETYNPDDAWIKAIKAQYGTLAPEMQLFAENSTHLANNWASIGRPDAPSLQQASDKLLRDVRKGQASDAEFDTVTGMFQQLDLASEDLLERLSPETLAECRAQLVQLGRVARAGELAVALLTLQQQNGEGRHDLYMQLSQARAEIQAHEREGIVSDAGCNFIDKVLGRR